MTKIPLLVYSTLVALAIPEVAKGQGEELTSSLSYLQVLQPESRVLNEFGGTIGIVNGMEAGLGFEETSFTSDDFGSESTVGAVSYTDLSAVSSMANVGFVSGADALTADIFISSSVSPRDVVTLNGDNEGAVVTIAVVLSVTGNFDVIDATIPEDGEIPVYDATVSLGSTFGNADGERTEFAGANLRAIIAEDVGMRPRVVTESYPFDINVEVTQEVTVGEPFILDFGLSSGANAIGVTPPADAAAGDFVTIAEFDSISVQAFSRIESITIVGDAVENPSVTSVSGTNYRALLGFPEDFNITSVDYDATSRELTLVWNSPNEGTYLISQSADLENWTTIESGIARTGDETTQTVTLASDTGVRSFFRVENGPDAG